MRINPPGLGIDGSIWITGWGTPWKSVQAFAAPLSHQSFDFASHICCCIIDLTSSMKIRRNIIYKFIYLFILPCRVFVAARGLSLFAMSWGYSSLRCAGFLQWLLLLQSTGSRVQASVVVAHGLTCSAACGIFPDQGSNPCPLNWQADS